MTDKETVFVVDDDASAGASVAALMHSGGLRSEVFDSAEAFLERFDGSDRGCLVLDMRLGGMSGPELHRLLRTRGINIPTILISGHVDSESTIDFQDAGVVTRLEKPYRGDELLSVVKAALEDL